jgi:hypothetical protein
MKRLRYLFAGILLLVSFPSWRLLDWANVILPFQWIITSGFVLWGVIFVIFPLKLILTKLHRRWALFIILSLGSLSWLSGPFTAQTTLDPNSSHCGRTSYTGFFYPARSLLSNAHQDDLELRNQMCWLVKMIKKVPSEIAPEDLAHHLNLMKNKLLKPSLKFRASLPWITFLLGRYLSASELQNSPLLVQNLGFWTQLYNEEISTRKYPWYEWPHSALIQFEYGLIEKHWEAIRIEYSP